MGPADFAKLLCDQGTLTTEQRGQVALLARDMQIVYDKEVARRVKLTDAQLRAEGIGATELVIYHWQEDDSGCYSTVAEDAARPESSTTC